MLVLRRGAFRSAVFPACVRCVASTSSTPQQASASALDASSSSASSSHQAVILAAGLGSRMLPFTETTPKCFAPIAGKPMIKHTLETFRAHGVDEIAIVRGHKGEVFEDPSWELGESVRLVDNDDYQATEVFDSFTKSTPHWNDGEGDLYVSYSDIVFSEHVLGKLKEAEGDICIIADRDFQAMNAGRTGHPFGELELMTLVERGWGKGTVNRIGKRCVDSPEEVREEVERGGEGEGEANGQRDREAERQRGAEGQGGRKSKRQGNQRDQRDRRDQRDQRETRERQRDQRKTSLITLPCPYSS